VLFNSTLSYDVKWYSNETEIISNEKHQIINEANSTSLLIKSTDINDQHEYRLTISNAQDKVTYKTYLFVEGAKKVSELKPETEEPKVDTRVPEILKSLEPELKVNKGENAKLACQFDSGLASQVEWFFNETNITQKVTSYREKFEYVYEPATHSATLIIKNVNEKDKGTYTFKAKNNNGVCKSTCLLDVIGKFLCG
jgi:hypothetical protein